MPSTKTPETPAPNPGKAAGRRIGRADVMAIVAIAGVLSLIDSEIVAYGVPGIVTATEMFHLPTILEYASIGVLSLLTLWLSVSLGRHIWRVEHEMNRPSESC